ncbi:MAG: hypothetical protein L6422_08940 [Candidatus Marinimicrobia bacterium]|nr:hypothetical protein [Candidatus Neomarinimicrobiota bacterium]
MKIDVLSRKYMVDVFVKSDYLPALLRRKQAGMCHPEGSEATKDIRRELSRDSSLVPRSSQRDLFEGMTVLILFTIPS